MGFRALALLGVLAISLSAGTALSPGTALADTVELEPDQDNSIYEEGGLSNGAGQRLFVGTTLFGTARRALVRFDLSSIPAGSIVSEVSFSATVAQTIVGPISVGMHRTLSDWGEGSSVGFSGEGGGAPATTGDATWDDAFFPDTPWDTPGGDFDAVASASTAVSGVGSTSEWSGTDLLVLDVQSWVDDPSTNFGWTLVGDEVLVPSAKALGSRETLAPGIDPPQLIITFTPPTGGDPEFLRGDCNGDGGFDISNAIFGLGVLFSGTGPAPCDDACDANDDGGQDIADMIYILGNLFSGGPAPTDPGPDTCGVDPTADSLECATTPCP